MLQFIKHRTNKIADLATLDPRWGAEIDLRSDARSPGRIHLAHDPWQLGDDFETWLDAFCRARARGPLILNTKEDGLEAEATRLLLARKIENYFFLDTTLPTLARWSLRDRVSRFAVRLSALEPVSALEPFLGRVDWIWLDCFNGELFHPPELQALRKRARVCLVSPELHGASERIADFRALAREVDAVCTKFPERYI